MNKNNNLAHEDLINAAYKNLAHAVIQFAVKEYQKALAYKDKSKIRENERFFKSKLFRIYSDLNGEWLMEKVKTTTLDFVRQANENFDANYVSPKEKGKYIEGGEAFKCPICNGHVYVDFKKLHTIYRNPKKEEKKIGKKAEKICDKFGFRAHCDSCMFEFERVTETKYYDNCDEAKHNN